MDQEEIERNQAIDQKTRPIAGVSAGGFVVSRPKVNESLLKKLIREELEEKKVLQDPTIDDLYKLISPEMKKKFEGMSLLDIRRTFEKEGGYADLKLAKAEIRALKSALDKLYPENKS